METLEQPRPWNESDVDKLARKLHEHAHYNLRLQQAAPELLAALEDVVRCFDLKDGLSLRDEEALKRGCAAIAKVKV